MHNRIKKFLRKYSDPALLILCIITYTAGFLSQERLPEIIAGAIGAIYCIGYLIIMFSSPIKRDWLLAKGNFLTKVINFALFIPLIITAIIHTTRIVNTYLAKDYNSLSNKELVNEDDLYSSEQPDLKPNDPSLLWTVYFHFIDPGNQHMATTRRGRIISGIVATSGFLLLNGLLISMLISWFDRRREQWLKGEVRYRGFLRRTKDKFYIVIGGNDVVFGIISELLQENEGGKIPYIVIQTSRDVEEFRRELFSGLTEEQQKHIIIYYGSRTSKDNIADLYIENAKEVYVIGEDTRTDDIESYHDTINMRCFELISEHFKKTHKGKDITSLLEKIKELDERLSSLEEKEKEKEKNELIAEKENLDKEWKNSLSNNRLKCYVMFEYQTTFSVFQFYDINKEVNAYINFKPFNYYEVWAQKTLINKNIFKSEIEKAFKGGGYLPLEGADGIKEGDDNYVHLFIVGMSRIGIAMAIEAAHLCHYPNYESKKIRTKITFIDKNAAEEKNFVIGRFKELFELSQWRYGSINESGVLEWKSQDNHTPTGFDYLGGDFLDIEWEFINGGIETAAVQNYILQSATPLAKVTIAVCLPESNRSHAAALFLDKKIYASDSVLQVLVYNSYGSSIVHAISNSGALHPYCGKLRHFGHSKIDFIKNLKQSEEIGRKIDATYCNINIDTQYSPETTKYKGKSAVANQWSSIYCGNTVWTKLRSIYFNPVTFSDDKETILSLAYIEHNRWNIEELLMNFRPLTFEEQKKEIAMENYNKDRLKGEMAHTDICSNKKLEEIDCDSRKYDIALTKCLCKLFYDNYYQQ